MDQYNEKNRLVVHENPNQKLQDEQDELDQLKRGLQESSNYDTIHPSKLGRKVGITDVTQNIFSMTMQNKDNAKKHKDLYQFDQRGVAGSSLGFAGGSQYD
jgi:hypothetical protein